MTTTTNRSSNLSSNLSPTLSAGADLSDPTSAVTDALTPRTIVVDEVASVLAAADHPPVIGRPVAQGDVLFVPDTTGAPVVPHWTQPATFPVTLVGEGNGHVLHPEPVVRWAPLYGDPHVIGVVEVPSYSTARIVQPTGVDAHIPLVLGPGVWTVRRQREATTPSAPRRTRRVLD